MKIHHVLIWGIFLLVPAVSRAEGTTPFQLSLVAPLALSPADVSVDGFRWNIIYGINEDFQGLDLGFVNKTTGNFHGFEFGAINLIDKDFGGAQFGIFNQVQRHARGIQIGALANVAKLSFQGVQAAAFFNDTEEQMQGIQIGIFNHAGYLEGIQIGILNFNDDSKGIGFLPFINAEF